jgi:single-strand DNA-binding protein
MASINSVVLVGNLTRDPELRHTPSGTAVCSLRLAVNTRRRDESGQWADKPNCFDVTVWGAQGENCAQYLAKGRPVAIDGRLEWREWETQDGAKRQAVDIIADNVQFLGGRGDGEGGSYVPGAAAGAERDDFPPSPADGDMPFKEAIHGTEGTHAEAAQLRLRARAAEELPLLQGQGYRG